MKLYAFLRESKKDYDAYDIAYDVSVTVSYIENAYTHYDTFCNAIAKKVLVEKQLNDCEILVNWSDLITRNFDKFKQFTKDFWANDYDNKDTFIKQWIREIHLYMAGCAPESFYKKLTTFVATLDCEELSAEGYTDYCTCFYLSEDHTVCFYDEIEDRFIKKQKVADKTEADTLMQSWVANAPESIICQQLE